MEQSVWSPDGNKVAFAGIGAREEHEAIYVVDRDGTDQRMLSPTAGDFVTDANPAWSPDGALIVFTNGNDFGANLWVMNADGTGRRRFVRGAYSEADQGLDWAGER